MAAKKTAPLSDDALYLTVRGLADMGEDYGWNVYYRGTTIPRGEAVRMVRDDAGAKAWLEAFAASLASYREATGERWVY